MLVKRKSKVQPLGLDPSQSSASQHARLQKQHKLRVSRGKEGTGETELRCTKWSQEAAGKEAL